jgi:hypothetical protein
MEKKDNTSVGFGGNQEPRLGVKSEFNSEAIARD